MTDPQIDAFLQQTAWSNAATQPLAGDASARRYLRLTNGPHPALLMIAPPALCGPLDPFIDMTAHLHSLSLRAPKIFAKDQTQGLLLVEDFGDAVLARMAEHTPQQETELYAQATDVLSVLHSTTPPDVRTLGPRQLAEMLEPLFTHYAPAFRGGGGVVAAMEEALTALSPWHPSLALRDYHAENLIVLDPAAGAQGLALLDYQDAVQTHPAYDLASLLQDARRLVPAAVEDAMILRFLAATGLPEQPFRQGYALIALQRNLRILGIFARLQRSRPEARYGQFQPLVWHHVQRMLATPACATLAPFLQDLPHPETAT